jgi:hypothetical protein
MVQVLLGSRRELREEEEGRRRVRICSAVLLITREGGYGDKNHPDGVRLVTEDLSGLEPLRCLEHKGVPLIACGTRLAGCVPTSRVRVGAARALGDILKAKGLAQEVITL